MSRATRAFVVAVALAAAVYGRAPSAWSVLAAAAGLAAVGWGVLAGRPRRWGLRIAYGLLFAYLVVWGIQAMSAARTERSGEPLEERLEGAALQRTARALSARLGRDRRLVDAVAGRLAERAGRAGAGIVQDPDLFVALGRVTPADLPAGVGLEVYDAAGGLRAWWGDPRGERLPPDSIGAAVDGALVRRPPGYTIACAAAPWVVGPDTFRVVVKDVWEVESPLSRQGIEADLAIPRLESGEDLSFRVVPTRGRAPEGMAGWIPIPGPDGRVVAAVAGERFLLDRYVAERRRRAERAMALLLLWPLVWAGGALWGAARRVPALVGRPPRSAAGIGLAILARGAVLSAAWGFVMETRLPARVVPASWFGPLGFASTALGPAGRSPGDFLVTAALAALFAFSAWFLVPARRGRRRWYVALPFALLAPVLAWVALGAAEPLLERAMQGMSPAAFFSPTLLFSPPLLMVLLGFALLAAVGIVALAGVLRAAGAPVGKGWVVGLGALTAGATVWAAVVLPEAAMAGDRGAVAGPVSLALAGSAWLVLAAGRPADEGHPTGLRFGLLAVALGALATLPPAAFARVQAAHELLVERAQRIGQASSQWLDYTMTRTVEFLSDDPGVAEAIREGNRDAALSLWSRSPLRDLDFATGLFLFDADGRLVSQFSLTAEDAASRARRYVEAVRPARIAVRGSQGTGAARWAVVPVEEDGERIGTAVALTTGALELRDQVPGSAFVLTDLMTGAGLEPDLPGYTALGPEEAPPPRTLLTRVEPGGGDGGEAFLLAMPLDPLLPAARGWAVFALVGALCGLALGALERGGDPRARARWWARLRAENPLRSFRVQLLLAFLAVSAVPLTLYAVLGYRATRLELEEATRSAAVEALNAASRMLAGGDALSVGTTSALSGRLRDVADVLQQDLILYWRGRTVASSRPEIFSSRLFADRMDGSVYADLFAVRSPLVFDATMLGGRSFLVAYRTLGGAGTPSGYVLATPLLIREDRVRVDLQRLGEGVFLLSAFSIGFLLIVGWGLARFMARPLSALEQGTRQIAAGRLSYRLAEPARQDEFGRLQRAFNAMAGGLDESQRALEREKSRVQAILASVGAGVVALDGAGRVRLLNDRAADLLGQRPEDVLARPVEDLAAGAGEPARFWRVVARERAEGRRTDRDLAIRRDGEERHWHMVSTGLRDAADEERGLVIAFEDITENVQSQRVLAWGEMARQVAHEIKNPLTPMKLSLQHLEKTVEDRAPDFERVFHENLELVLTEIDRLERIAGSFARFAVPEPAVTEPFDALAVARDVVALFAPGEERIDYAVETAGEPRPLVGDAEGFRRVLVNLLQNAREAVLAAPDAGGRVVVRFDWTPGPDRARVSVLDDGIGLPEAVDRLFEPSFSTKTRGTGLGLAITRRIVEAWGGSIDWERRDPSGTAIHLTLRTVRRD